MIQFLIRYLILFLVLTGAVAIASQYLNIPFGDENYWNHHGVFVLIGLTFFPRLTLLFSSIPFGGLIWWLGWIFAPRALVAVLATLTYWHANPSLVMIAWLVALGGEFSEKAIFVRSSPHAMRARRFRPAADVIDVTAERKD